METDGDLALAILPKYLTGECYNEETCQQMAENMKRWEEDFVRGLDEKKGTRVGGETETCAEGYTIVNNLKQYGRKLLVPSACGIKVDATFEGYFQTTGHAYAIDATSTYVVPLVLDFDCVACRERKLYDVISPPCRDLQENDFNAIRQDILEKLLEFEYFDVLRPLVSGEKSDAVVIYRKPGNIDCNFHVYFSNISVSVVLHELIVDYLTLHLNSDITEKYIIDNPSSIPLPYSAKYENSPYKPVGTPIASDLFLSCSTECYFDVSGLRLVEDVSSYAHVQVCEIVGARRNNEDDDEGSSDQEQLQEEEEYSSCLSDTWFTLDKNIGQYLVHDLHWKAVLQTSIPDFVLYTRLANRKFKEPRGIRSARFANFIAYVNNYTVRALTSAHDMYRLMDTRIALLDESALADAEESARKQCILKNLRLLTKRIAQVAFRKDRRHTQTLNDTQLFAYLVRFVFGPKNCCGYSFYAILAICLFLQKRASTRTIDRRGEALRIKKTGLDVLYTIFTAGINFIHSPQAKQVLHTIEILAKFDCIDQLTEALGVPEYIFGYITTMLRLDVLSTDGLRTLFGRVRCYMNLKASRIHTGFPAAADLSSKKDFMNYCIERAEEVNLALQALFEEWLATTFYVYRYNTRQETVFIYATGAYTEVEEKISDNAKSSILCTLENVYLKPVYLKIAKNFNFNQKTALRLATFGGTEAGGKGGSGGQDLLCKLESVRTLFQRAWSAFIDKKCIIQTDCYGYYPFFIKTSLGIFNTLTGQYMLPIPFLYFANEKSYCTVAANDYAFEKLPISSGSVSVDAEKLLTFNGLLCTNNYPNLMKVMEIYLKSQSELFYLSILVPGIMSAVQAASGQREILSMDADQLLSLFEEAVVTDLNIRSSEQRLFYLAPAILRFNFPIYLVITLVEILQDVHSSGNSIYSATKLEEYLERKKSSVDAYAAEIAARVEPTYRAFVGANALGFSYVNYLRADARFECIYDDFDTEQFLASFLPTCSPVWVAVSYLYLMLERHTQVFSTSSPSGEMFAKIFESVENKLGISHRLNQSELNSPFPYTAGESLCLRTYHAKVGRCFGANRNIMTFLFYPDESNDYSEMYRHVQGEGLNLTNIQRALNYVYHARGRLKEFATLPLGYLEMFATLSLALNFYSTAITEFLCFLAEIYQPGAQRKHLLLLFGNKKTGKSYILKLLELMHGQSAFGTANRLGSYSANGGPNTESIELNRCYLCVVHETFAINASLLRVLTGSDSQHYRSMYKDLYVKYKCTASIVASSNRLTKIVNFSTSEATGTDADDAVRERIVIFEWNNRFVDERTFDVCRFLQRNPLFYFCKRLIAFRNNPTDALAMAFSNMIYAAYLLHRGSDGNINPTLTNFASLECVDQLMRKNNYVYRVLYEVGIGRDHSKRISHETLRNRIEQRLTVWRSENSDRQYYTWDKFLVDFETMFSDCVPSSRGVGRRKRHKANWTYHGIGFVAN